ncbi:coiled-coil domain-containing protein 136-like isoform X2 [Hippocampus zosterae]|uniref:coiled-coil domain-containing protein 136-like isoform X2 n=1 Tax=Hippocampus zosterae TaxID=109293 RepID=UPI00223D0427|nr:coiled-coil domain-containing protein 136-like isoform X2 [Hippocampus zosterae]
MDAARFPPLLREASDAADDLSGLEADSHLASEEKDRRREKAETQRRDGDEQQLDRLRVRVPQLLLELDRARETSAKRRSGFLELQGLLEDERLSSAHQAEAFARQIQNLQAQLRSAQAQAQTDGPEEEEAGELAEAREELRAAREEAVLLRRAAEEAAAERENDIAWLQEELCRRRAELGRLGDDARRYRLDPLKEDCRALKEDNRRLAERLQLLRGWRTSPSTYLALREEEAGIQGGQGTETPADEVVSQSYMTVGRADAPVLKNGGSGEMEMELKRAEDEARRVQRECHALKSELRELQELYDGSQRERRHLEEELGRCKAELQKWAGGDPGGELAWKSILTAAAVPLATSGLLRALARG